MSADKKSSWVPSRSALAVLAALTVLTVGYVVSIYVVDRGPDEYSPLWDDWVYNAILLGAGTVAVARGVRDRQARLAAWSIGGAILAWALGNIGWSVFLQGLADPPYPSVADIGYLLFYPPAIVGVLAANRSRVSWRNPVVVLDGLIAGLSVTAIGAVLALGPIARAATGTRAAIVTNLSYPIMDVLTLGLVLTLAGLSGWRLGRDQAILLGSLALFAVSDSVYLLRVATSTEMLSSLTDAGWPVSIVAMAWSQWTVTPVDALERPTHGRAVWVPVAFVAIALGVFGPSVIGDVPPVAVAALAAALAAAGGRMVVTLKQMERLAASEREAREDRIAALASARDQIEAANAALELRVLERTADLEASNRRLTATGEKLRQSNRELQDFAYVASHDLQEPLRKVQAFGSRLESRFGDVLADDGRDYLQRMQGAAKRMSTLIDDLLTFSRVASRAEGFRTVDLTQIAREVIEDLEVPIAEAGARLDLSPLDSVEADPTQMRQLLQNLLGNALKFRRADVMPVVSITSTLVESPAVGVEGLELGTYCRLQVRDNGIGFDEKYLERIFTVFQRLHGRNDYSGSGIGLAVCRRIVERHHGHLTATSTPDNGATFTVHLPVRQPEELTA